MGIGTSNVTRGAVLGQQRFVQRIENAATGTKRILLTGINRIVAIQVMPNVDQSAFANCTARLFAEDGTTPLCEVIAIDVAAGVIVQSATPTAAANQQEVNAGDSGLVLAITNPASSTLDFDFAVIYSAPLVNQVGGYIEVANTAL